MSPGGTDASLLELVVGFFVAVSLIAVLTMILRRRGGRQDLLGTQVREMEERTAAATAPEPDTRLHEAATRVADARVAESRVADARVAESRVAEGRGADARVADAQLKGAASRAPATAPADAAPIAGADAIDVDATSAAAATTADATSATARAVTADAAGIADVTSAVGPSAAAADVLASGVRAVDATAPPDGWPVVAGGKSDALVDAFAWLRIAALVEAGQREQAVELLSATMGISVEEAEMLVDGLNEAGGERRPD